MHILNLFENDNTNILAQKGCFKVLEYDKDLSQNSPTEAMAQYFMREGNIRKRQVVAELSDSGVILEAGAMQLTAGSIKSVTNVKNPLDLVGKFFSAKMTGESAIKPVYRGSGIVVLEPKYKHFLLVDVAAYGNIVLSDKMFLACEDKVELKVVMVKSLSGGVLGKEGLFNLCLRGKGVAVLESPVPLEELIEIQLNNDELKIDGNYAVMWDDELDFTVERSSKSLIGSAVNGEGLVNVYRGTGSVWLSCVG